MNRHTALMFIGQAAVPVVQPDNPSELVRIMNRVGKVVFFGGIAGLALALFGHVWLGIAVAIGSFFFARSRWMLT